MRKFLASHRWEASQHPPSRFLESRFRFASEEHNVQSVKPKARREIRFYGWGCWDWGPGRVGSRALF
jgi:hypothetical protein